MPSLRFLVPMVLAIKISQAMSLTPFICLSSPALPIEAGSSVVATIDNPQGIRCDARIRFTDPDFLDVNFGFDFLQCMGSQTAEFAVPPEVPNGDAFIIWECAGQSSRQCNHVWITQGTADPEEIAYDLEGTIGCLVPTATITTLSTIVGTSTTMIVPEITTAFSTSFSVTSTTTGTTTTGTTMTGTTTTGTTTTGTTMTGTTTTGTTTTGTTTTGTTTTGTGTTTGSMRTSGTGSTTVTATGTSTGSTTSTESSTGSTTGSTTTETTTGTRTGSATTTGSTTTCNSPCQPSP